jgi:hypothetical protein
MVSHKVTLYDNALSSVELSISFDSCGLDEYVGADIARVSLEDFTKRLEPRRDIKVTLGNLMHARL